MQTTWMSTINHQLETPPTIRLTRTGRIVNENGEPTLTKLPFITPHHPYFQMEALEGEVTLITPSLLGITPAYDFLTNLHHLLLLSLPNQTYFSHYESNGTVTCTYTYSEKLLTNQLGMADEKDLYLKIAYYRWFLSRLFNGEAKISLHEGFSIEIQFPVNPFDPCGITPEDLKFLHLFMIYLLINDEKIEDLSVEEGVQNQERVRNHSYHNTPLKRKGRTITQREWALAIFNQLELLNQTLNILDETALSMIRQRTLNAAFSLTYLIHKREKEMGTVEAHLSLAKAYKKQAYEERFRLIGHENLELSTQILMKESIKKGLSVDVLDPTENFISLSQQGRLEYVKQATKTSKDNYVSVLMMENKLVTKKILEQGNIRVPKGGEFHDLNRAFHSVKEWSGQPLVIKPKSTNFGLGISIFQAGATEEDLKEALRLAFSYDQTVLVEEFISGKEYRFLVIDDEVVGVLHRVPANVVGDGVHTIVELTQQKNENPLRGKGYRTPLEKIQLDEQVELFLKQSQRTINDIPAQGEIVYLRKNSNISTGGDSIDFTDVMPTRFKELAVMATKVVGAKICGVDMMIEDEKDETSPYAIIELNFNPAIHIHSYPSVGVERNIAERILILLQFA